MTCKKFFFDCSSLKGGSRVSNILDAMHTGWGHGVQYIGRHAFGVPMPTILLCSKLLEKATNREIFKPLVILYQIN